MNTSSRNSSWFPILVSLPLRLSLRRRPEPPKAPPPDAVQAAQTTQHVAEKRPEQHMTAHDRSDEFKGPEAPLPRPPSKRSPTRAQVLGFDFARDPLNSKKPMQSAEEIKAEDKAAKPKVMEAQRQLLEKRYNLEPKLDPEVKMSRGKPLAVGPTARLPKGMTWDELGKDDARSRSRKTASFLTRLCRIPKQTTGGQVFPAGADRDVPAARSASMWTLICPRHSCPNFPPAIFPAKPARAGRRLARRRWFPSITSTALQGHPHAGAARRPAAAADASAAGGIQCRRTIARPSSPASA